MKKKMLGIVLVLLVVLTACTNSDANESGEISVDRSTAFAYYQTANDLIEGLRTIEMVNELDIAITIGESEFSMPMINLIAANTISETEIEYAATMIMPLDGGDLVSESYYKDGYMYMNMYGEKIKAEIPVEDVADEILVSRALDFEEEAILTYSVEGNADDGGQTITMTLDGTLLTETLESITETLRSQIDYTGSMQFTYSDVNLVLVTDQDQRMSKFSFDFEMSFVLEGEEGVAHFQTTNEIVAIENVVIRFPDDLDTYIDMAEFDLGMYDEEHYEDDGHDD